MHLQQKEVVRKIGIARKLWLNEKEENNVTIIKKNSSDSRLSYKNGWLGEEAVGRKHLSFVNRWYKLSLRVLQDGIKRRLTQRNYIHKEGNTEKSKKSIS